MSDPPLPPDLHRLLTLRTDLRLQLASVDEAIERIAQFRVVPIKTTQDRAILHRASCRIEGGTLIDLATARQMYGMGDEVEACQACDPGEILRV